MDSYEPVQIDLADFKKAEAPKPKFDYKNNYRREKGEATFLKLHEITSQTMENNCTIQGYVFKTELIKTRAGKHIQTLWITDYTDSIMVIQIIILMILKYYIKEKYGSKLLVKFA